LNLARREADIALRATNAPAESLVGRRICTMRWAIYCAPELARHHGDDILERAPWIGFGAGDTLARGRRWFERYVDPRRQVCRVNTLGGVAEFAALGAGAAILPCFIGDSTPGLIRVGDTQPELDVELWLLTHADLRHSPRVRVFMDYAGPELCRLRRRFEGDLGAVPELTTSAARSEPFASAL
jgi:DNA-binding transcriptional LysR family regulator